ncbi:MAG: protein kinase [Acidobacteria bacterium]|nr:protein kinase [Bryobacteraceae bacterium CoA2 C42]
MTPQRYTQVKSLFQLVLDQPADQRPHFLEKACGADRELYLEVRSLLLADSTADNFLSEPAVTPVSQILAEAARETDQPPPSHIGPYAIQRQLGTGGMGTVYLASRADQHYSKLVALKVIRHGMEQDRIIHRFRRERQIVASLDHPNIARLLDGGAAEDGRPYFVMEYVEGVPIDTYCDERKLSTEDRLCLFCTVCAAVHYAHQNLVVHRDLKPGNILVKPDGVTKLLDFGIAKILSPDPSTPTEHTATSMRLMTPQYASPEQLRGEPVTTVSDVYLLGIILYELLTGHRPYRSNDALTLEHLYAMTAAEPEPPSAALSRLTDSTTPDGRCHITKNPYIVSSTRESSPQDLKRKLRGELDAIVLKALRRNPTERYQSAAQLADDLRRFLAREPVSAVPENPLYRVRLFLTRNRAIAATVAAALTLVLLFAIVAAWQARTARLQRDLAARRFEEVRQVANSFLFEVHDSIADLPGTAPARRLLATKAVAYLANLSRESTRDTNIQSELAAAWIRLGHLQGNPHHPNLGDIAAARRSYQTALQILRTQPAPRPLDLAAALEGTGDLDATAGDSANAHKNYSEARQLLEANSAPLNARAGNYQNLAAVLAATGRPQEALTLARHANDLAAKSGHQRLQSTAMARLAAVQSQLGLQAQAKQSFAAALELAERLNQTHPSPLSQRHLSFLLADLATFERAHNDPQSAVHQQRSLTLRRTLAAADPRNIQAQRDLAYAYLQQTDPASLRQARDLFDQQLHHDPHNPMAQRDAALAYQALGNSLLADNQIVQAVEHYRRSLQLAQQWQAADITNLYAHQLLAAAHVKLSQALPKLAAPADALASLRRAVTLLDDLVQKQPTSPPFRRDRAHAYLLLGRHLLTTKTAPALPHLIQAKTQFDALAASGELNAEDQPLLAELTVALELARSTAF